MRNGVELWWHHFEALPPVDGVGAGGVLLHGAFRSAPSCENRRLYYSIYIPAAAKSLLLCNE